jgi:hypothetical protein
MVKSKVQIKNDSLYTLSDLKKFVDEVLEKADGGNHHYTVTTTLKGRVTGISVDTGKAFGVKPKLHDIVDPSHGNGGAEWCRTHNQLASRCEHNIEPGVR